MVCVGACSPSRASLKEFKIDSTIRNPCEEKGDELDGNVIVGGWLRVSECAVA